MRLKTPSRRAVIAFGATLLMPRLGRGQDLRSIVVGGVVAEDTAPLWYAMSAGLFARAGIGVNYQKLSNGSASTLGVVSGAYNIANTNPLSAILAHVKGVPLTIVTFSGMYDGTPNYLAPVVRKDSPLQTAADLNGRVFGTSGVRDLSSLALMSWMDKNGGDSKTLKVVEIPYSVVPSALEEGRIDIGTLLQPFLSSTLALGKTRIFANSFQAIAPRFVHSVWVATPAWAVANSDTVQRFARVVRDAQVYCNAHHSETASILAQHAGVDLDALMRGEREVFTERFADPRDLQPLIDVAARYGVIDRRFEASDLISPAARGLRA